MLKIKNVSVSSYGNKILNDISLTVNPSEIHAIIGPKHSGKSALTHVITGHPGLEVNSGSITLNDTDLLSLETHERVNKGIFIGFQAPLEFDLTSWDLTKLIFAGEDEAELKTRYNEYAALLGLNFDHDKNVLNGSSMTISQAKRNDFIYMLMSGPKLVILDDIDEELEEHEIVIVAAILREFLNSDKERSCIIVSSSKTMLDVLKPTHVHVLVGGEIQMSGEEELYKRIIEDGYSELS